MTDRQRIRNAARVFLLDESGCVLLFRGHDSTSDDDSSWWLTPGGGVEAGESALDAARRELFEETGLTGVELAGPVGERRVEFDFEGVRYDQHEVYFVARAPRFEPSSAAWTDVERRSTLDARWWSIDELRATAETVYPERIVELLVRLA